MLAGAADRGVPAGQLDACVGLGAVPDEVAGAVSWRSTSITSSHLEGAAVVDVRNDCDSHVRGGPVARAGTVLRVRDPSRHRLVESMLLTLAAAEGGVRLLSPRERPIEPARDGVHRLQRRGDRARARDVATRQLALGLGRAAIELGALALVVREPAPVAPGGASGRFWPAR